MPVIVREVMIKLLVLLIGFWISISLSFAQISAASYIVMTQDGRVLIEHNANEVRPIASITKLVTLGEFHPTHNTVYITDDERDLIKNTRMRFKPGAYSEFELFEAALINSNNEAAKAVGKTLIADVNAKNHERGLQLTIVEPSGLNPSNVGTAKSLAILAWSLKDTQAAVTTINAHSKHTNTNSLLAAKGWEFSLSKTGYIKESGGCLVALVKMGGEWVAVALMGSQSVRERWIDLAKIRKQIAPGDMFYEPQALKFRKTHTKKLRRK